MFLSDLGFIVILLFSFIISVIPILIFIIVLRIDKKLAVIIEAIDKLSQNWASLNYRLTVSLLK